MRRLLIALALAGCATAARMPELGASMPCRGVALVKIAAAESEPACAVRAQDIGFQVAGRDTIAFIETLDPLFRTPEGIHVGSTFVEVALAGGAQMQYEPGWRYFATLPSGWSVAFPGVPDASYLPGRNARVTSLFRR